MPPEDYAAIPESLTIREVRFTTNVPGFCSDAIVVATTLLDPHQYSRADIADLYHQRGHAELDIRAIKQTLSMEMIHRKKPATAPKALWTHLLGYNLVRKAAAQATWNLGLAPRQISFDGAQQTLEAFNGSLAVKEGDEHAEICRDLLSAIATHIVGHRPSRIEPRPLKRRYDRF